MSNLRGTLENLASQFALNILGALRGASIDELLDVSRGGSGGGARRGAPTRGEAPANGAPARRRGKGDRLGRRSADDIGRMVESIVNLLQSHPEGLRAEQIRESLGVEAKELPRPLAEGIAGGRLSKTGQKRATTYFVGSGEGGGKRRAGGRRAGGGRRKKA